MLKWIALVLAAALAAIVLWKTTGGAEVPPEVSVPAGLTEPGAEHAALVETDPALTGDVGGAQRREVVQQAPTLQGLDASVELAATIAVQVVSQADGRPAADAEILFLDRLQMPEGSWQEVWYGGGDVGEFVERNGQALRTDAAGMLHVPRTTSGALVARVPRHRGTIDWIGVPQEPVKLALIPLPDLVVQVVDEDGRFVPGVPIAVCMNRPELPWNIVVRSTDNIDGSAPFMNLDRLLRNPDASPGYAVGFAFPLRLRQLVPFRLAALPEEPIRLVIPPTGSVTVTLANERGEPFQTGAQVSLGRTTVGDGGRETFRSETAARIIQGRASFPFVGVGTRLTIRVDGVAEMRPLEVLRDGPTRQGEALTIDLTWTEQYPVIVGRAVLPDGTAIASRNGRFMVDENMIRKGGASLVTDLVGRFRVVVRDPWTVGMIRTGEFFLYPNDNAQLPSLDAELDLTYALEPGENDVGDIVFVPMPLVAAGQIVDQSGKPLAGVLVFVETPYPAKDGTTAWRVGRDLAASTGVDGRFEVYGHVADPELRVRGSMRDHRSAYSDIVPPGTVGITLTMIPGQDDKFEGVGPSREKGGK